jgi:hypothetical protein
MDNSAALQVQFRLVFGDCEGDESLQLHLGNMSYHNASVYDLTNASFTAAVNPTQLPGSGGPAIFEGTVDIPAGEDFSDAVVLVPETGDGAEGLELFRVQLVDGPGYVPIEDTASNIGVIFGGKIVSPEGHAEWVLGIVDGVVLFAPNNSSAALRDYATDVSELGDNPGINANDVRQGAVGNCYFMAAVRALTIRDWTAIKRLFHEHEDGSISVALYEPDPTEGFEEPTSFSWKWVNYPASDMLSRGFDTADFSGDVDDDGNLEIWTLLLERRFMESQYFQVLEHAGQLNAWKALTGCEGSFYSFDGMSDEGILAVVQEYLSTGDSLLIAATQAVFSGGAHYVVANSDGQYVFSHHAYNVESATADGVFLENPWGHDDVRPLETDLLDETLAGLYVFEINVGDGPGDE